MPNMDFGVGMGRSLASYEIAEHARAAEAAGYKHLTFIDSQNLSRDCYVNMTIAALATQTIRIGQGVTNTFTRHPFVTANATATVNELSGGRAFIAIGAGMSSVGTLGMRSRSMKELREAVETMYKITSGESVQTKGGEAHSEWMRDRVPIYIGSNGVKSMKLAGAMADGCIVPSVDPEIVKWRIENIRQGAIDAGRDPEECDIWIRTMCVIANSKEAARSQVQSYAATGATSFTFSVLNHPSEAVEDLKRRVDPQYLDDVKRVHDAYRYDEHERIDAKHGELVTDRIIDAHILCGTLDDVGEQITRLADVGVKTLSMTVYTVVDKLAMMDLIGRKLIPIFR